MWWPLLIILFLRYIFKVNRKQVLLYSYEEKPLNAAKIVSCGIGSPE